MTDYKELKELLDAMDKRQGFNHLCRGNGWGIEQDVYRDLFKELLYAIEECVGVSEYYAIITELQENVPEYWTDDEEETDND